MKLYEHSSFLKHLRRVLKYYRTINCSSAGNCHGQPPKSSWAHTILPEAHAHYVLFQQIRFLTFQQTRDAGETVRRQDAQAELDEFHEDRAADGAAGPLGRSGRREPSDVRFFLRS